MVVTSTAKRASVIATGLGHAVANANQLPAISLCHAEEAGEKSVEHR